MTKFLLYRPIAVFMVTLALLAFSLLAFWQLPVSLLPAVEVPSIIIKLNAPGSSPAVVEANLLKPLRENLLTLNHLTHINSTAKGEAGTIELQFTHKARMDLMYVEVNERIDRLQAQLPPSLERPRVIRVSTADIPVMHLQVQPKNGTTYGAVSKLATHVLKRRIEQIEGVSVVDVVGKQVEQIEVLPNMAQLETYHISLADFTNSISKNNVNWGSISVKDGQYRYYVKLTNLLSTAQDIGQIPVANRAGQVLRVRHLATLTQKAKPPSGYHLFRNRQGLAIIIHKQANARIIELTQNLSQAIAQFKKEYSQVSFYPSQDQSVLLQAGISNLKTALLYGGIFAFLILFLFMSNIRLALIMGVSLPVSLLLSFLVFYLAGISINIVSLSGLALGLGMLIDNAIIVLDNISAWRTRGYTLVQSCVQGVQEVQAPLVSSVLTTLAVFVPLVYLHGMAGALFYDQALAVAAILGVSLLVAFTVLPLLYKLWMGEAAVSTGKETQLFARVTRVYNKLFFVAWQNKKLTLLVIAIVCGTGVWLGMRLPKSIMPPIEKNEVLLHINWNEPIDLQTNKKRVRKLTEMVQKTTEVSEAEIGILPTLLSAEDQETNKAEIYFKLHRPADVPDFTNTVTHWFKKNYPNAITALTPAPNAFDKLFANNQPFLKVKLRAADSLVAWSQLPGFITHPPKITAQPGKGFLSQTTVQLQINTEALATYEIPYAQFMQHLKAVFGTTKVTTLKHMGDNMVVVLTSQPQALQLLNQLFITANKVAYPLSSFVQVKYGQEARYITADYKGGYQAINYPSMNNVPSFVAKIKDELAPMGILTDATGTYFESRENLTQLMLILGISFVLLYFILAAQFESFVQPLVIIFTLPLGVGGSLLLLAATGISLNLMSGIGIIVMLGIMINDAILKLDTINRYVANAVENNMPYSPSEELVEDSDKESRLFNLIHQAGVVRLRPILMTSLTTILALIPVLFTTGLGADLQRGLVIAVIGGLTIGTFTALFFVPLLAYYFYLQSVKIG